MEKDREALERLENLAHDFAFTTLGLFYWENFCSSTDLFSSISKPGVYS